MRVQLPDKTLLTFVEGYGRELVALFRLNALLLVVRARIAIVHRAAADGLELHGGTTTATTIFSPPSLAAILFVNLYLCDLGARNQLDSRGLLPHNLASIRHRFHLLITFARMLSGLR